jgi:hypothetical protein
MAYKLNKESISIKKPYYNNYINEKNILSNEENIETSNTELALNNEQTDKDYINVVKKVKKENITPDNIGEIMLCQIPGISSVTAIAIMNKFQNIYNMIEEIELNPDALKDITYTNSKGQIRKINKTSTENIVKFLLKK